MKSFAAILSLLPLISALPSPTTLAPRCGTTILPSTLQSLHQGSPDTVFPNTASTGFFEIYQQLDPAGGPPNNKTLQLLSFTIPPSSYGCSLSVSFPSELPPNASGPQTVIIHALTSLPSAPTYDNISGYYASGTFGQVRLVEDEDVTINSATCPVGGGQLAFVVEYAPENTGSSFVDFTESETQYGIDGFYATYNC